MLVFECVCNPYIMGTKCLYKYTNTSKSLPCGDIFKVPMTKQAYNELFFLTIYKCRKFSVMGSVGG